MSLLQNEEFILYQLRTSYLNNIKDGVGERLINVNSAVLNNPAFRAAGWTVNVADLKRSYSPPIPTAITSEYFQAPPRSARAPPAGFGDDDEEGGMITGGASNDTIGPGPIAKRRRRREQLEEDDSSDLSDESDEESEAQRAAQQIKFAKMPVRARSGSSPIRSSNLKEGPSVLVTSPSIKPGESRLRRDSLGAVEAVKERARRDTTTSSDLSSENELDPSVFKRKQINPAKAAKATQSLAKQIEEGRPQTIKEAYDLEDEDSGDDTDGTTMSSEFGATTGSTSILAEVASSLAPLAIANTPPTISRHNTVRQSRPAPPVLQALPPPRPISTVQPVSALGLAIKARNKKPASPFDAFASLSGKGESNALQIKIYTPFSNNPGKPFEVLLRRTTAPGDNGIRQITVADAIGFSLWRYAEENIPPPISGARMNVNKWTLRIFEDGEVDFDFPALDRKRPIVDLTPNNNRLARARSRDKLYDEFALVEATDEQFLENERITPGFAQESSPAQDEISNDAAPQQLQPSPPSGQSTPLGPRLNPLLGLPFNSTALRNNSVTPADTPALPSSHATPRTGASKILKIHFTSADAYTQTIPVDVTTDTYIAEVLDTVCKKWNFDKAHHILKVSGTNTIAPLDRTVEAIGGRADLDLIRRRFGNDGPLSLTGSPGSTSPNAPLLLTTEIPKKGKKGFQILHPLAQKQDILGSSANYRRYNVVRKQPMSLTPSHPRVLAIDGEYIYIMPGETGKTIFDAGAKTTTIHFSSVVGCKVSRRHPKTFRVVVFKERESKRYDFEAQNVMEAAEIVQEIKKGIEPFSDDII
ncbi:MAG: hypothetical protein M1827_002646 [Pycnora praestabilis]|nr:MAG: hypothetical protein M1827_002646 [Pycnora praestabilis]